MEHQWTRSLATKLAYTSCINDVKTVCYEINRTSSTAKSVWDIVICLHSILVSPKNYCCLRPQASDNMVLASFCPPLCSCHKNFDSIFDNLQSWRQHHVKNGSTSTVAKTTFFPYRKDRNWPQKSDILKIPTPNLALLSIDYVGEDTHRASAGDYRPGEAISTRSEI